MKSKCLWLVYSSYHLLNFFFSSDSLNCAANIACGTTETDCPLLMEMPISVAVVVVVVVLNTL